VAELLSGWKSKEAEGLPLTDVFRVVNEQTGDPLEEPVARVLREGRAVALANHAALVTRDSRTVPIEDSAAPILDCKRGARDLWTFKQFMDSGMSSSVRPSNYVNNSRASPLSHFEPDRS
jgi:PAS domain-containing protein